MKQHDHEYNSGQSINFFVVFHGMYTGPVTLDLNYESIMTDFIFQQKNMAQGVVYCTGRSNIKLTVLLMWKNRSIDHK
jgi:hypothetical protein